MYGDPGFFSASVIIYNKSEITLLTRMAPRLLLGLCDHIRVIGEHPACTYGDLGFSMAAMIMYSQSESPLLECIVTSASPRPPRSCTCYRRAPCLHVWQPRHLLGLCDHLQSVGEHPAYTYGDLSFSSASEIIYNQSESTLLECKATSASPRPPRSCTCYRRSPCLHVWHLGFSSASAIMYVLSESTLLARMATSASPWPP